jgi:hypothetical protein
MKFLKVEWGQGGAVRSSALTDLGRWENAYTIAPRTPRAVRSSAHAAGDAAHQTPHRVAGIHRRR